jgi:hypothetical protein
MLKTLQSHSYNKHNKEKQWIREISWMLFEWTNTTKKNNESERSVECCLNQQTQQRKTMNQRNQLNVVWMNKHNKEKQWIREISWMLFKWTKTTEKNNESERSVECCLNEQRQQRKTINQRDQLNVVWMNKHNREKQWIREISWMLFKWTKTTEKNNESEKSVECCLNEQRQQRKTKWEWKWLNAGDCTFVQREIFFTNRALLFCSLNCYDRFTQDIRFLTIKTKKNQKMSMY